MEHPQSSSVPSKQFLMADINLVHPSSAEQEQRPKASQFFSASSAAAVHPAAPPPPPLQQLQQQALGDAVPDQARINQKPQPPRNYSLTSVHPHPISSERQEPLPVQLGQRSHEESALSIFLNSTSWTTGVCLGLCSILAVSSLLGTPFQDVLALLAIGGIVGLFPYDVNSVQLGLIALMGLVLATFNLKQLFFASLLGFAGKVAIAREGLLYYAPRSWTLTLVNSSIIDLLEQPFQKSPESSNEQQHSSSLSPLSLIRTISRVMTQKGLLFASLPETVRWALLPGDMRASYEEQRRRLIEGHEDHPKNGSLLKSLVHFENKVTEVVNTNVNHVERLLLDNPAVRTVERITTSVKRSTKEAFSSTNKERRVGALLVISTVVYILTGWSRATDRSRTGVY